MSSTSVSPRGRRVFSPLHVGAVILGISLLLLGIAGRRSAVREAQVQEIATLRDQLQRRLEASYGSKAEIASPADTSAASTDLLVRDLQGRILRLHRRERTGKAPDDGEFEILLATATAANAAQQFDEALRTLDPYDEKGVWAALPGRLGRAEDLLQARGDSLFGLGRWREAADRYQQILTLHPGRAGVGLRLADCQSRMGERSRALALLTESARTLKGRADRELQEGQFDRGIATLEQALIPLRRLCEHEGQSHLDREHVAVLTSLAWVYAAAPDPGIRNATKARQHAETACRISGWQSLSAVEALAAAHAESRDFPEAARLQSKALELAPPAQRPRVQSTLDRYTSAAPTPPP